MEQKENPCCVSLKSRYTKMVEYRNHARKSIALLETHIGALQEQNIQLKHQVEALQADQGQKDEQLNKLKSEMSLWEGRRNGNVDTDAEVQRLRELLAVEIKRVESEKRIAEEEKRLRVVAQNQAEELRRSEERTQMEFKSKVAELKSARSLAEDESRKALMESQKSEREKKNADIQRTRADDLAKSFKAAKDKARKEKEHADYLLRKLEIESKKLREIQEAADARTMAAEAERKEAVEEKLKAEYLLQQLRVEAQKQEEDLQRGCLQYDLLRMSLKFGKEQGKCAKKFAKIQKAENKLLRQELDGLKQTISHILQHLHMMDSFMVRCRDGRCCSLKLGNSPSRAGFCRKNDLPSVVAHNHNHKSRNTKVQEQTQKFYPCNCRLPKSGLNLNSYRHHHHQHSNHPVLFTCFCQESHEGSSRQLELSSVGVSTSTTFSDGQFTGSHKRGMCLTDTATELTCRNTNDICAQGVNMQKNANILSVNPVTGNAHDRKKNRHVSKKRKISNTQMCGTKIYSEDDKLHLDVEENRSAFTDQFCINENEVLAASRFPDHKYIACKDKEGNSRKRKPCSKFIDQKHQIKESTTGAVIAERRLSDHQILEKDDICIPNLTNDYLDEDGVSTSLPFFKDMVRGNIMKFFELDNKSDEERYRVAVGQPLSPTLPILDPPSLEQSEKGAPDPLVHDKEPSMHFYDSFHGTNEATRPGSIPGEELSKSTDYIIEPCLATSFPEEDHNPLENPISSNHKPLPCNESESMPSAARFNQSLRMMESQSCNTVRTSNDECQPSASGYEHGKPSRFYVYCATTDENDIHRVASTIYALACQMSMAEKNGNSIRKTLFAGLDIDIKAEEKMWILLSVLIDLYSGMLPPVCERSCDFKIISRSLKTGIQSIVSGAVIRKLLGEVGVGCKFFCLIQDFLISRKILNCIPIQRTSIDSSISTGKTFNLNGVDVQVFSQHASHHQLVAAGLILASACSLVDDYDFLRKVSCDILLSCGKNFSWALAVLHTFAYVCGVDYFSEHENGLSIVIIRCAVSLLESNYCASERSLTLASESSTNFLSCKNCPFAQDTIGVGDVIQILFRRLEECVKSGFIDGNMSSVAVISKRTDLGSNVHGSGLFSTNDGGHARCLDLFADDNFSDFMEAVSFMELVGCHMDWTMICDRLLPNLMALSNKCGLQKYSVTLLLLVGKLSRLGIGPGGGYGQNSIAEVRSFLLRFLDLSACNNPSPLPVQYAAFEALLDLLPTNIRDVIVEDGCETIGLGDGISFNCKTMRDWFLLIGDAQKVSLQIILQASDCPLVCC